AFEHLVKPGAVVINISAPQAFIPMAMQAHVCAAKAGVDMLTRVLAVEWGGVGVRVNGISPGPIEGTEGVQRLAPTEAIQAEMKGIVPLQRFGTPEEIGDLALFLASDAAKYISGAVITCDGGQSLMGGGVVLKLAGG
ncbi:MAG: short chain dehydrogenase, partial [Pseudomonadota bacterium]